ncbi:hypothetical protein LPMP_020390 [Leishmania panamensis]|uniref:Uncharacterized protein n=3 Tax=Leishmania guyanensis species complex TaxID=38579 RepID=A0A088RJB2_LEIPA|nr:hypothetical protein LPMP_020390 [Leishmania panamensis]AIN95219.1 hypothetical protein LPMP_020390 [Leishmania panamensis]CCM12585.1 hypothetical protein, conserved [Leishmania guyanensis]
MRCRPLRLTTRAQARRVSFFPAGLAPVTAAPFTALTGGTRHPQPRSRAQGVHCGACLRRTATVAAALTSASSPCWTPTARFFTNAKKSYARGTEEEQQMRQEAAAREWRRFLAQPVDADGGNAPTARSVEDRLPTKKQLSEELPTMAELDKALREGRIDAYAMKLDKDEE